MPVFPCVWKIHWRRKWHSSSVFFLGESHGQGSLAGYSPWGCKELDTTEQLNTNQWLRIHLPMQGLWVRSLVGELRSHMPRGN